MLKVVLSVDERMQGDRVMNERSSVCYSNPRTCVLGMCFGMCWAVHEQAANNDCASSPQSSYPHDFAMFPAPLSLSLSLSPHTRTRNFHTGFGGNFQISTAGKVTIVNKRPKDKDGKSTDNWFKTVSAGTNSTVTLGPVKDADGQTYQTVEGTGNVAGSIHCHIDGNCGYRGELIISSKTADVRIVILDSPKGAKGAPFDWSQC